MNEILIIVLAILIIFIAYLIRGLTGFANSMIAVPFLALFLDIKFVIPVVALTTLVAGASQFLITRKNINRKELFIVLVFVIIGSFIGVYLLLTISSVLIKKVFGIFVILFSLHMIVSGTVVIKKIKRFWRAVAGFLAGLMGGLFDTNGPPLAIYFGNRLKKAAFVATINMIFLIDSVWRNILYFANGLMTMETIRFSLILLPGLILGIVFGHKINIKINEALFKKVIGAILLIAGVLLVF